MSTIYATRDEAIDREIIAAITATGVATADEYDIEAIADTTLEWAMSYGGRTGYRINVDVDFWAAVEAAAL